MLLQYVAAIVIIFVLWTIRTNSRPKGYPKGPISWPVLGNFPHLAFHSPSGLWHLFLTKCTEKYGKIFAFDFGTASPSLVVSDVQLIKEAYNNPAIQGRLDMLSSHERTGGVKRGIVFHDGPEWYEQRRFSLRHLRDFGFGKTSMESMIIHEITELLKRLKEDSGKPISTLNYFNISVLNALWTITTGERLKYDDPKIKEVIETLARSSDQNLTGFVASFFPALVKVAPKLIGWQAYCKDLSATYEFLKEVTLSRIKTYDSSSLENFSDAFIREMQKTTDPDSSFYGEKGPLNMTACLLDLFVAGSDTTSTTMTWTCLYLALNPRIQKKLHEELDSVLGDRDPSFQDRPSMPYMEAVIMETLRDQPVIPMTMHRATEDTHLGGYFIPKNTGILANMYAVQHDPTIWGDPNVFRPERFINDDGSLNAKQEALLPFSIGKRACIGESLARNELFLFLANIFKNFEVTWDPSEPKPALEAVDGLVIGPKKHKLVFTERK